jgi:AcrR family transcriptional regulator
MKVDSEVQKLTPKGRATRQRIIDGAAAELRVHGAVATRLEDVMAHTGTSKSQLFHYFPRGKDQLLLAVAEQEAARVISDQQPHLSRLTSWAAWQRWRDVVVERYRRQGQQCPLSTVMSELGRTPGAQAVTGTLIERWRSDIEAGVVAMQRQGKIADTVDPARAAAALLAGIQGGVSVLLNTGDLSYLEAALDFGIAALRCR